MSPTSDALALHSEWPRWTAVVADLVPVAIVVVAVEQRHAFSHPSRALVYGAIIAIPWLLNVVGIHLPKLLFHAVVLLGVTLMILHPAWIDMSVFVLVFLAGEAGSESPPLTAFITAAAACAVVVVLDITGNYTGAAPWVAGILLAWAAGSMYRAQRQALCELRAAQADLAAKAATDERQRIAREVHDVIAHSLTVTLLHITGARLLIATEPQEAADALLEAERFARDSLAEIRQTVGLLKTGESGTDFGPLPGAGDIPSLIAHFSDAGLPLKVSVAGELSDVPAAMGLGVYRIVQESLTNVAKHAPGAAAELAIDVEPSNIRVLVRNNGGGRPATERGSGVGIAGMAERAAVLGGTCVAGPTSDGWEVALMIPRVTAAP